MKSKKLAILFVAGVLLSFSACGASIKAGVPQEQSTPESVAGAPESTGKQESDTSAAEQQRVEAVAVPQHGRSADWAAEQLTGFTFEDFTLFDAAGTPALEGEESGNYYKFPEDEERYGVDSTQLRVGRGAYIGMPLEELANLYTGVYCTAMTVAHLDSDEVSENGYYYASIGNYVQLEGDEDFLVMYTAVFQNGEEITENQFTNALGMYDSRVHYELFVLSFKIENNTLTEFVLANQYV